MANRKKALMEQLISGTSPPNPFQRPPEPTPPQAMEKLFGRLTRQDMCALFQNHPDKLPIPQNFEIGPETPIHVPETLTPSEHEQLQTLQAAINRRQKDDLAYEQASALKIKYPDLPMIAELILGYLVTLGDRENMLSEAKNVLTHFPFNVYARNLLVLNALSDRNLAEVEAILENKFEIYAHSEPQKTVFETPEVLNFYGALGNYYVLKGNIPRALWCYIVCREAEPQGEVVEMLSQTILTYLQDEKHQKSLKDFLAEKKQRKLKKLGRR